MVLEQNNWWDTIVWGALILFLIPSTLAVASWNSTPGSRMYRMKLFMEDAVLAVAPTQEIKGTLHVAFTERRFSEAKKLLIDKSSMEGLAYLNQEVLQAKENIQKAPSGEARQQLAQQYITTLRNVNSQLIQQQQLMASTPTPPPPGLTPKPTIAVATHNPSPSPTPLPVSTGTSGGSDEIDDTIDTINATIDDLNNLSNTNVSNNDKDHKESNSNVKSDQNGNEKNNSKDDEQKKDKKKD